MPCSFTEKINNHLPLNLIIIYYEKDHPFADNFSSPYWLFFGYLCSRQEPGVVKQAFNREFAQVKDVEWTSVSKEGIYQAKFIFNNETLQAFFTEEGEFLGTTREIVKAQLPILVVTELEKQYAAAHVATIFEYSKKDGTAYYITIITNKGAMVLKATGNGELTV